LRPDDFAKMMKRYWDNIRLPIAMLSTLALVLLLSGCGGQTEKALEADTAEESANDLITFFENAEAPIKQLAKTASDALEQRNYTLAINCVNQLFANAVKLNADQFMVASETMVNIQQTLIEAAEGGDKKAQWLLNTMVDIRRG
jgi:type III secretory pathway lipoprotein EscJ